LRLQAIPAHFSDEERLALANVGNGFFDCSYPQFFVIRDRDVDWRITFHLDDDGAIVLRNCGRHDPTLKNP
jgi:hypothetical protein